MLPGREGNVMSSFWTAFALGFAITGIAHLALPDASSPDEPMTPGAVILGHANGCRAVGAEALMPGRTTPGAWSRCADRDARCLLREADEATPSAGPGVQEYAVENKLETLGASRQVGLKTEARRPVGNLGS